MSIKMTNWLILSGEIICVNAENHMQATNTHVDKMLVFKQGIFATTTIFKEAAVF